MLISDINKIKKGFTLIELLVVIAILGILATLVVLATNESRARGRDARRMTDAKVLSDAFELYIEDNKIAPEITNKNWDDILAEIQSYLRGGVRVEDPLQVDGYKYVFCSSNIAGGPLPKSNYLVASVLETEMDIRNDLDGDHGYTEATQCLLSTAIGESSESPSALNCSDDPAIGQIDGIMGTVNCIGYYRND